MKRKRVADAASITAAIGAGLCCLGPFVLVALGAGAAAGAVSAFFAPLRPWLLATAFGIVGWRFFVLYRPTSPTGPAGPNDDETCRAPADGAACPPDVRRRERVLTWGVLALIVVFATSPYWISALPAPSTAAGQVPAASAPSRPTGAAVAQRCLAIGGMTCSACAGHVEAALSGVSGVVSARVDYDGAEACVEVDPARVPSDEALFGAVERSGYRAAVR